MAERDAVRHCTPPGAPALIVPIAAKRVHNRLGCALLLYALHHPAASGAGGVSPAPLPRP
jgi:hypothetical protein